MLVIFDVDIFVLVDAFVVVVFEDEDLVEEVLVVVFTGLLVEDIVAEAVDSTRIMTKSWMKRLVLY